MKNLGIRSYETLYDSYILPIINYGAGVWGFAEQSQPQVLQNRIKRCFMGVNRFAPNAALNLEFGWNDMKSMRWLEMARYWNRLCEMKDDRWPKKIAKWDISLRTHGWTDQIRQIVDYTDLDLDLLNFNKIDLDVLDARLHKKNETKWLLEAHTMPKLRTFVELYSSENARDIIKANLPRTHRSVLVKLKIGVLLLQLETGRWKDTPLEYRLCRVCNEGLLENELHFLLQCEKLIDERSDLCRELLERTDFEIEGDSINQMKCMFKASVRILGKHVATMFERRRELLYECIDEIEEIRTELSFLED